MIRSELKALIGRFVVPYVCKLGFETRQLYVVRDPGKVVLRRYQLRGWSRWLPMERLAEREHVATRVGPVFIRTIYGEDRVHPDPYMTQAVAWRLRFHVFHRGDNDEDAHDHPWSFWTFPLTSYVEEITEVENSPVTPGFKRVHVYPRVVKAWRLHFRGATHTHRVLGRWNGRYPVHPQQRAEDCMVRPGKVVSLVWNGTEGRSWGFRRKSDGCWVPWKRYVYGGGKHAPCGDP